MDLTAFTNEEDSIFLVEHMRKSVSGSSVLSVETVENILNSVKYVVSHSQLDGTYKQRFLDGKELIQHKMAELEELFDELSQSELTEMSEAYDESLQEVQIFLDTYDIDYDALRYGDSWFDYQLAHPIDDQVFKGIHWVEEFLGKLKKETLFMEWVPKEVRESLLAEYGELLGFDYRIDVNNLYEILFDQILAQSLVNPVGFMESGLTRIGKEFLMSLTTIEVKGDFKKLIDSDEYYQESFAAFKQKFTPAFIDRLIEKNTENVANHYVFAKLLTEKEFVETSEALSLLKVSEKIAHLSRKIYHPKDLLELMKLHYFTKEETLQLFEQLSLEMIFSLLMMIRKDNRDSVETLTHFLEDTTLNEQDKLLQHVVGQFSEDQKNLLDTGLKTTAQVAQDFN